MKQEQIRRLHAEIEKLHARNELSETIGPDYFELGMMEYLDQFDGVYDEGSGEIKMCFEVKGTRYEGRTELIETVRVGDPVNVIRDSENAFNNNNFTLQTNKGRSLGNIPKEICDAIAPLYDTGEFTIEDAHVSFVDPISKRSRHAKQAVLFVELKCKVKEEY